MKKQLLITLCLSSLFAHAIAEDIAYQDKNLAPVTVSYAPTPLLAVFNLDPIHEKAELSSLNLTQSINAVENPTEAIITLTESNLPDDAIEATQNTYFVNKSEQGWAVMGVEHAYKCRRGEHTMEFINTKCP
ncbi:hypothetical protein B9T21_05820 [Wohlfahrtiimonas chitiniclastica]|uniref:hypothetical protein n=1 Tax=Wohlfahrtiimonas chitiniclastica TaxID=400946 RepID=UPI000B9820B0|nr:hypothetical protein [Wohlfahrtiimonas chitiniclastica]OYQ87771.1 hypothetical protein B9T21_05820 [Wohlfahrtiimonas chitiniclastica]